ncbi:hypothetical protein PGH12_12855 [Chryseobacterium wangxinyae]|uniref:hypothetical protein n=1 Tax=Chryseobacterium sp. CY350 TaxID=2997336 RepID=UPI002270E7E9|nr:hypothetical protein [Chryseobacterium sp. CY350]MCY0976042.1 hypothetical protein [Chryseobacterium sp. CY350]WBZ94356.1 hypothetical protein PGH12_12855 [Chryseobacterium sp. CY350]
MKQTLYFSFIFIFCLFVVSCKKDKKGEQVFEKFSIDQHLPQNDTIKLLSKYPELKLYKKEKLESKTRTAYIVQIAGFLPMDNYKCSSALKNDTLEISLNNNNGFFGNGILVKVFGGRFLIKDIDPKTLHGEIKFMKTKPVYQKLILNKYNFQKKDTVYGLINYNTKVEGFTKDFRGYFKAIVK